MKKRKTLEELILKIREINENIEISGEYINNKTKVKCKCNIDGYEWEARPDSLINGRGCQKCARKLVADKNRKSKKDFIGELNELSPNVIVIGEYITNKIPIKCKCKICNGNWEAKPNGLLGGSGCPVCQNKKVLEGYNDIHTTNPELVRFFSNEEDSKNFTFSSGKEAMLKCPTCGFERKVRINSLYNQGFSCPKCGKGISKPEKIVLNILEHLNVEFKIQKMFEWNYKRFYDFYIPSLNCIIETHGMQHYKTSFTHFNGKTLEEEQENDRLKEKLARENGIEHYIVIDCRYSKLSFIRNNIENSELKDLIDLNKVDWDKCEKFYKNYLI